MARQAQYTCFDLDLLPIRLDITLTVVGVLLLVLVYTFSYYLVVACHDDFYKLIS